MKGSVPIVGDISDPKTCKPSFNRVLVRLIKAGTTPGGLHIPDTASEDVPKGVVEAVGPGVFMETGKWRPVPFEPGDVVLLPLSYVVVGKTKAGDHLLMCPDTDLLGTIVDAEPAIN